MRLQQLITFTRNFYCHYWLIITLAPSSEGLSSPNTANEFIAIPTFHRPWWQCLWSPFLVISSASKLDLFPTRDLAYLTTSKHSFNYDSRRVLLYFNFFNDRWTPDAGQNQLLNPTAYARGNKLIYNAVVCSGTKNRRNRTLAIGRSRLDDGVKGTIPGFRILIVMLCSPINKVRTPF